MNEMANSIFGELVDVRWSSLLQSEQLDPCRGPNELARWCHSTPSIGRVSSSPTCKRIRLGESSGSRVLRWASMQPRSGDSAPREAIEQYPRQDETHHDDRRIPDHVDEDTVRFDEDVAPVEHDDAQH